MKKFYTLVWCVVLFNGYAYSKDTYNKRLESEVAATVRDECNRHMIDNYDDDPAFFDALDELATQDRSYREGPARQPFHAHLPGWVKEFGVFLLMKYVSYSMMISKSFKTMKRKLLPPCDQNL